MKARWIGAGSSSVPSPSSVVISLSANSAIGVTQENTGSPSTSTVQAPHWPSPQPNFAALSFKSPRST